MWGLKHLFVSYLFLFDVNLNDVTNKAQPTVSAFYIRAKPLKHQKSDENLATARCSGNSGWNTVKPQIGQTAVPIYKPQEQALTQSTFDTISSITTELSSDIGNLLNVHGEDYAETAFQWKLRAEQKKSRERRM